MGSRVQANKAHKTRFSSKAKRDVHKTSKPDKGGRISKKDRNVAKGAKAARIQRNKMIRDQKRAAVLNEKRASSGSASPPRIVVLFGLTSSVNTTAVAKDLISLLSPDGAESTSTTFASPHYKIRTTVLEAPHGDLLSCMEMAKVADLIAFVASASCYSSSSHIDSFATQCLSVFKAIGLPNSVVLIRDLPKEIKKRNDLKQACISSLSAEFPEDSKFFAADTKDDLHKFMDIFKEQRLTVPHWRRPRPYLMAHEVDLIADDGHPGTCTLLLSGYLRARNLSVNQLVHVSGIGDFQLSKIDVLNDPCPLNLKKKHDSMDSDELHSVQVIRSLVPDASKQEPLLVENIPDPLAGEQTWPTEAEMAEADEIKKTKKMKRKVPRGTSSYQAAWILDHSDENDSDADDDENDGMALDEGEDGSPDQEFDECESSVDLMNSDGETEADTMMTDGEHMTKEQVEAEIRKIKEAQAEDEGYPDEVDTPVDVPARERFMKYRGIKSWKTSSWDPKDSLPPDYARIFEFDNFTRTQKLVLAKALDMQKEEAVDECIPAGSYVRLHVKEVPLSAASKLCGSPKTPPVLACGLLQHESKMSVLHFRVEKHSTYDAPIKAKEPLVFHVGFRQFIARPIFSTDDRSDKHRMERFLHAGRSSVASIYAPISFPPQSLIVLKCGQGEVSEPAVTAVGKLISIDPDRLILKRIVLTGYPQRVSKSKATVRFMFHNPEDVKFFKPVEVTTKCGRRGRVIESVGTHGVLKCKFDGVVQQHDTVCMALHKRVYPKWPEQLFPLLNA